MSDFRAFAALHYRRLDFDLPRDKPMGRHVANRTLAAALLKHGAMPEPVCLAPTRDDATSFAKLVKETTGSDRIGWIGYQGLHEVERQGILFTPDPGVAEWAWRRRRGNQRGFSICGVTYTISSDRIMQTAISYARAPLQPWDLLICAAPCVKSAMERMLAQECAYLRARVGAKEIPLPRLEVAPLGIDAAPFAPGPDARGSARAAYGLDDKVFTAVFHGRLSFHAKAHPLPMYLALEAAAAQIGRPVALILSGWFANEHIAKVFKDEAARLCPSVRLILQEQPDDAKHRQALFAADVFISLADNVQESFGLAPVEAMAAGIPVVVSDWDGYRDLVRDGVDGYLIPTLAASPGLGSDLAMRYEMGLHDYDRHIGLVSQFAAIDSDAACEALVKLATNPDQAKAMGASGMSRAREVFDWEVVVAKWRSLWQEMAEIRARAPETAPMTPGAEPIPFAPDPFALFSAWPSAHLSRHHVLSPGQIADPDSREATLAAGYASFADPLLLPTPEENAFVFEAAEKGTAVGQIVEATVPGRRGHVLRGLVRLAKLGLIRLKLPQA
jgi:starch synthase